MSGDDESVSDAPSACNVSIKEGRNGFAVGPHDCAGLRQGEVGEVMARLFGLEYHGTWGHFAPVKVNDVLTLDFDDSDDPRSNHYCFLASDEEFDAVLQRVKDEAMAFGSGPRSRRTGISTTRIWVGVLLRVRERACVGGDYAHVRYGLRERRASLILGFRVRGM